MIFQYLSPFFIIIIITIVQAHTQIQQQFQTQIQTQAEFHLTPIIDPILQTNDYFGASASVSGDYVAIGAPDATRNSLGSCGLVSMFHFDRITNSWIYLTELNAPDPLSFDFFGNAVVVDSASLTVIVGTPRSYPSSNSIGVAHVFQQSNTNMSQWLNISILSAPDPQPSANFGSSIALSGDTLIIGAYHKQVSTFANAGGAYIFALGLFENNWNLIMNLTAFDASAGDMFGQSVAIDGNLAIICSSRAIVTNTYAGACYIFSHIGNGGNPWGFLTKITAPDPSSFAQFGNSVAISNGNIFVGAYGFNGYQGATYTFKYNPSNQVNFTSKFTLPNPIQNDNFGSSVAIEGSFAMVGASGRNIAEGQIEIFELGSDGVTWDISAYINDPATNSIRDQFGISVSIQNNHYIIGSVGYNVAGVAYSLELTNPSSNSKSKLWIFLIVGISAICIAIGSSITITLLRRYYKNKLKNNDNTDDLLEFSPRRDMNFIDIHEPNQLEQQQKKRRASIESGMSIATASTQYSNASKFTTISNTSNDTTNSNMFNYN